MTTKNSTTRTKTRTRTRSTASTATTTPSDVARRARTLLVLEAAKATVAAYRNLITSSCDEALEMLKQLEPFTRGRALPPLGAQFGKVFGLLAKDQHDEEAVHQLCVLTNQLMMTRLPEVAVIEAFAQATACVDTPVEVSLRRIREEIGNWSPCDHYMESVECAFRAVAGGTDSHRKLYTHADPSDRLVIATERQGEIDDDEHERRMAEANARRCA